MDSLSARIERLKAIAGFCSLTITALAGLSVATAAKRSVSVARSLCVPGEVPLFSCPVRSKLVSVCGRSRGRAVYRYGRPGKTELQSQNLTLASRGFSGGGETQIWFENEPYRYIVFDRTVRTSFGPDGRNDPAFSAGLVLQKSGRTLSTVRCGGGGGQAISADAPRYLNKGTYIAH